MLLLHKNFIQLNCLLCQPAEPFHFLFLSPFHFFPIASSSMCNYSHSSCQEKSPHHMRSFVGRLPLFFSSDATIITSLAWCNMSIVEQMCCYFCCLVDAPGLMYVECSHDTQRMVPNYAIRMNDEKGEYTLHHVKFIKILEHNTNRWKVTWAAVSCL